MSTAEDTSTFMADLISMLRNAMAPRVTMHGVLVEVYGEGLLITGDSGVGKSETALELIKRGHRLIADDAVEIRRISRETLIGTAPELIRYYMELRGIGVINARHIFGVGAVKPETNVDLVVNFELWDDEKTYDRLGLETEYTTILGVHLPSLHHPRAPGPQPRRHTGAGGHEQPPEEDGLQRRRGARARARRPGRPGKGLLMPGLQPLSPGAALRPSGLEIRENEPMSEHCSFRIGGPAAAHAAARLGGGGSRGAGHTARRRRATLIMGNGTNLLVRDGGYAGAVVCMSKPMSRWRPWTAGASAPGRAPRWRPRRSSPQSARWPGWSSPTASPAASGGGVAMNAGAYGGELKDVLESVEFMDEDGAISPCPPGSWSSRLPAQRLHRHRQADNRRRVPPHARRRRADTRAMRELIEKRRASQPLDMPSAGSTFKRPAGGYAAAMIDAAG